MNLTILGVTALLLGLRHGVDIDHIAAMLDMAGTSATENSAGKAKSFKSLLRNMKFPALYVLGHGVMVVLLGLLALFFGTVIPPWLDKVMERTVGVTLLLLSAYLIYSLYMFATKGEELKLRSRWMVLFKAVGSAWCWIAEKLFKHEHHHDDLPTSWDGRGAFAIGAIHGFGAETGTQVLLFASVAGVGSTVTGLYMLLAFTFGMVISTMLIGFCVSAGLSTSRYFKTFVVILGVFAALFSLVVGLYFTFGVGNLLPSF